MRLRLACSALFALLALGGLAQAGAPLPEFNRAVEDAASHNRVALGYLRTGNTDLAQLEIERLRASWAALVEKYGGNRPDVFEQKLYTTTLIDISTQLVAADMMLKAGRPEVMETSLNGVRVALSRLRRESGVTVLADCVLNSNAAMAALGVLDKQPIDWSVPDSAATMTARSKTYREILQRCDGMAEAAIKSSPEFRRLIDGAIASLALIPKAVADRDGDLFHRVIIELRSYDNLLTFRFG